jgi:hypothetical protein
MDLRVFLNDINESKSNVNKCEYKCSHVCYIYKVDKGKIIRGETTSLYERKDENGNNYIINSEYD